MPRLKLVRSVAALSAAALAALFVVWAPPAGADAVPFSDPNAQGFIGFCDATGHQIKSGDIGVAPFTVTAVSSSPAPVGYTAGVGRGVLLVYQPIKDVAPGDWSGKQLTAASSFTNTSYPMTQGLGRDPALVDFVSVFPPNWNGLVEFRMYFTAPNHPQHSTPYPATVVRVSGTTWTQVNGGDVPCNAGKATSVETIALPKSALTVTRSAPSAPKDGPTKSTGNAGAGAGTSNGASAPLAASGTGADAGQAATTKKSSSNGVGAAIVWSLVAAAVAASAVAAILWRRRGV